MGSESRLVTWNRYVSFIYPMSAVAKLLLLFWVLDFWEAAQEVVATKTLWRTAVQWTQENDKLLNHT